MHIIGVDESGRGSLAGPVIVAAVAIPKRFYPKSISLPALRDSKRLTPSAREAWFNYIKAHPDILYATGRVYPRSIDAYNIANASNLAAKRALSRLLSGKPLTRFSVYLDGSLYIGTREESLRIAKTLIRGDQKIIAIKLASIVAKVTRDRYMDRLHAQYPQYHFNLHKGYGTALHKTAIQKHGLLAHHRATFLQKL